MKKLKNILSSINKVLYVKAYPVYAIIAGIRHSYYLTFDNYTKAHEVLIEENKLEKETKKYA